ncbi:MAG: hypothetical protein ACT4OO_12975 [Nitrospiraceae bacterium]
MRQSVARLFAGFLIGWSSVFAVTPDFSGLAADDPSVITQSAEYFPDAVGNRWQYRGQVSEGPLQTIENKFFTNVSSVTGTKTVKGASVIVFHDINAGNHGPSDSFYRRDAVGIVYYGSEPGTPLEQQLIPYQIVRFPLKLASSFQQFDRKQLDFGTDIDGDGTNEKVDVQGEVTVLGKEGVTVPAGTYPDAVKVEARMILHIHLSGTTKVARGSDVMTAWFAKGVGLAKYIERQELPPFRTDRGLVTEITEELEEYVVKPPSASLSRSESPAEGIFRDHASNHELSQIFLATGLRAHAR